jgi:5'-3' exoribonuclease 1
MAQASEVLTEGDTDLKVPEVKSWPKLRGIRDFAPVSLFSDQLAKVVIVYLHLPFTSLSLAV